MTDNKTRAKRLDQVIEAVDLLIDAAVREERERCISAVQQKLYDEPLLRKAVIDGIRNPPQHT